MYCILCLIIISYFSNLYGIGTFYLYLLIWCYIMKKNSVVIKSKVSIMLDGLANLYYWAIDMLGICIWHWHHSFDTHPGIGYLFILVNWHFLYKPVSVWSKFDFCPFIIILLTKLVSESNRSCFCQLHFKWVSRLNWKDY